MTERAWGEEKEGITDWVILIFIIFFHLSKQFYASSVCLPPSQVWNTGTWLHTSNRRPPTISRCSALMMGERANTATSWSVRPEVSKQSCPAQEKTRASTKPPLQQKSGHVSPKAVTLMMGTMGIITQHKCTEFYERNNTGLHSTVRLFFFVAIGGKKLFLTFRPPSLLQHVSPRGRPASTPSPRLTLTSRRPPAHPEDSCTWLWAAFWEWWYSSCWLSLPCVFGGIVSRTTCTVSVQTELAWKKHSYSWQCDISDVF